jgi:hypothetical protein
MGGILQVDTIQNNNTSNLITQTNVTTITIGTSGQTVSLASGSSSSGFGEVYNGAVNWTSTLVTSSLTVSAGVGYFVNTSTASITLTLPSTPTFGNIVGIVDYSGYASTNNIIINPNGNKIEGSTTNQLLSNNGEGVLLNYIDTTRGWIPTSGINEGTDALEPTSYTADFLVIAGGGGGGGTGGGSGWSAGGGGAGGYRNSYSTETSGGGGSSEASLTFNKGTVYTITVGAGGNGGLANSPGTNSLGTNGVDSSISGSDISTITSSGGGGGGSDGNGKNGGSGGGGSYDHANGLGTANQGFNGGNTTGAPNYDGGGGGGAGEAGNTDGQREGGDGLSSSITGSSVARAGGGGAGETTAPGSGGDGGGGNGSNTGTPTNGTTNTGSGGGGGNTANVGGNGGKGVVILRMPTAKYSGTTTGSPTVGTSGADTILTFNDSGSYTG